MRTKQIQMLWREALLSVATAEYLHQGEFYKAAISESYYAILYAAKAALLVQDIHTKSHSAVQALFSQHLVRTRQIEMVYGKILSREHRNRTIAVYTMEFDATLELAEESKENARLFLQRIKKYLQEHQVELE